MPVYFPAIDGCRAIAVAAVVLFHLGAALPAGFVGVDVFFVISGFVVATASKTLPTTSLRAFVVSFYARRVLRIAPALVVCVLVTMALDSLLIPQAWLSDANAKTGIAALFGASNLALVWTANDYWAPRSEFNPFTHTWSLGVEEQFYLLFPLVFFVWARGRRQLAAVVAVVLIALSVVSLVVLTRGGQQTAAFYTLQSRFWELGIGVGLCMSQAIWQPALERLPRFASVALGLLCGGVLALSLVSVDPQAFPWPGALAPVLATSGLIALCVAAPRRGVVSLLAQPPVVWLGKLSYSLYLWHWPVVVFMRWTVGLDSLPQQILAGALSLTLAAASYRWIELPVRHGSIARSMPKWRVVALGLVSLVASAGVAAALVAARPVISMSTTKNKAVWSPDARLERVDGSASASAHCEVDAVSRSFDAGRRQAFVPHACGAGSHRRVFVAGDSHAWAYSSMLRWHAEQSGDEVVIFTLPGCGVFGLSMPTQSTGPRCERFTAAVLAEVAQVARPGDILFLPSLRVARLRDQWGEIAQRTVDDNQRAAAVTDAVERLRTVTTLGVRVVFEAPKPIYRVPLFRCSDWFNRSNPDCRGPRDMPKGELESLRAPVLASLREVASQLGGVAVWDPFPMLCPGERCSPTRDGRPLFFDGDHLTAVGNATVAASFSANLAK